MMKFKNPVVAVVLAAGMVAGCGDSRPEAASASTSSSPSTAGTVTTMPATTTSSISTTSTTASSKGLSDDSRLSFDGIGPIRVGMTLAQASAALGRPVTANREGAQMNDVCTYADVAALPSGLAFMLSRAKASDPWRIVRVDVEKDSRIATVSGIRIGATEADVRQAYSASGRTGTLKSSPHKYVEGGHYLTYDDDGAGGHLLLFETDGQKVTAFRSGQEEPVNYVESCL